MNNNEGLNLSKFKQYAPRVAWTIVGLVVLAFIFRVAIWEHDYYTGKEGSERAVAESTAPSGLDETEPTDLDNYTVAADRPRFLSIEKLGIERSRVVEVGIQQNGELNTPGNIYDTGWYFESGKPGAGGTMLLDGHNGGPTKEGVFKHLDTLTSGDIITIERGDGAVFRYQVVENVSVDLDHADEWMSRIQTTPEQGRESLSIITCTGEWSQARNTYLSRQFLRAVLVD